MKGHRLSVYNGLKPVRRVGKRRQGERIGGRDSVSPFHIWIPYSMPPFYLLEQLLKKRLSDTAACRFLRAGLAGVDRYLLTFTFIIPRGTDVKRAGRRALLFFRLQGMDGPSGGILQTG